MNSNIPAGSKGGDSDPPLIPTLGPIPNISPSIESTPGVFDKINGTPLLQQLSFQKTVRPTNALPPRPIGTFEPNKMKSNADSKSYTPQINHPTPLNNQFPPLAVSESLSLCLASLSRRTGRTDLGTNGGGNTLQTDSSSGQEDSFTIVSIAQFRSKQSVGIAAIDLNNPELILAQFSDNQTYTNTLTMLHFFQPDIVLLPDSAGDSIICNLIGMEHPQCQIQLVKRCFFNDDVGAQYIERLCIPHCVAELPSDNSHCLAISSSACLLKYIETVQKLVWAPHSIRCQTKRLGGYMQIDFQTARALELVYALNTKAGNTSSSNISSHPTSSLYATLNHTVTRGGARLLRSSILHPLRDLVSITTRLDSVSELIANEELFFQLRHILPLFSNIETLCSQLVQLPKSQTLSTSQQQVINISNLRRMLDMIPELISLCSSAQTPLFQTIASNLSSQSLDELIESIDSYLNANSVMDRKQVDQLRIHIAYAVKDGIHSRLDIARQAFSEAIQACYRTADEAVSSLELAGAKLVYKSNRGYHLVMPASSLQPDDHMDIIIQRIYSGNKVSCTTPLLQSLNQRQDEAFHDTCFFTSVALGQLLSSIRIHISWLYTVSENISILDLLSSFGTHVSLHPGFTRPQLTETGPILIRQGKHPVFCHDPNHVANDVNLSSLQSLAILTGPNNAGKSTHLRQLATMVVMAHIGCFIPAEMATIRVMGHIVACMSTNTTNMKPPIDSSESTSAFFNEMKQMSWVLSTAHESSLVLIDEVGRSTSSIDGMSIAWSICEQLSQARCFGVVVTHYLELSYLPYLYPNICTKSMEVDYGVTNHNNSSDMEISEGKYVYKVQDYTPQGKNLHYGIALAQSASFPQSLISDAKAICQTLENEKTWIFNHFTFDDNSNESKSKQNAKQQLLHILLAKLLGLKHLHPLTLLNATILLLDYATQYSLQLKLLSGPATRTQTSE